MLAALAPERAAALCAEVTIDLDTTDVEVYGRKKRGVADNHQGQRCERPHVATCGGDRDGVGSGPDGRQRGPPPTRASLSVVNTPQVDHVSVYRWVQRFTPLFIDAARPCRHAAGDRWFVDETHVKVAGRWVYLYRATDQFGQVINVLVSKKRDWQRPAGSSLGH